MGWLEFSEGALTDTSIESFALEPISTVLLDWRDPTKLGVTGQQGGSHTKRFLFSKRLVLGGSRGLGASSW